MSNRSKQRKLNQQVHQDLLDNGDLELKVTRRTHKAKRIRKIITDDDKSYRNWLDKHGEPKVKKLNSLLETKNEKP